MLYDTGKRSPSVTLRLDRAHARPIEGNVDHDGRQPPLPLPSTRSVVIFAMLPSTLVLETRVVLAFPLTVTTVMLLVLVVKKEICCTM